MARNDSMRRTSLSLSAAKARRTLGMNSEATAAAKPSTNPTGNKGGSRAVNGGTWANAAATAKGSPRKT